MRYEMSKEEEGTTTTVTTRCLHLSVDKGDHVLYERIDVCQVEEGDFDEALDEMIDHFLHETLHWRRK